MIVFCLCIQNGQGGLSEAQQGLRANQNLARAKWEGTAETTKANYHRELKHYRNFCIRKCGDDTALATASRAAVYFEHLKDSGRPFRGKGEPVPLNYDALNTAVSTVR